MLIMISDEIFEYSYDCNNDQTDCKKNENVSDVWKWNLVLQ